MAQARVAFIDNIYVENSQQRRTEGKIEKVETGLMGLTLVWFMLMKVFTDLFCYWVRNAAVLSVAVSIFVLESFPFLIQHHF